MTVTRADEANFNRRGDFEDWLYKMDWELESSATATCRASIVSSQDELIEHLQVQLNEPSQRNYLDSLSLLDHLAVQRASEIVDSVDSSAVQMEQQRYFGLLQELAGRHERDTTDDQQCIRERLPNEFALLTRCIDSIPDVLNGKTDAAQVLFPDGDTSGLTWLYRDSPGARLMNRQVFEVVSRLSEDQERPIRVLEVGAGTGGTTTSLLPLMSRFGEYAFTDISPLLVDRAREQLGNIPQMSFSTLDVGKRAAHNDLHGKYDIVIAANVLHATADVGRTLNNVASYLNATGALVLIEGTQRTAWLDMIFGMTKGWWVYQHEADDPRSGTNSPLLAVDEWTALLRKAGMEAHCVTPDDLPQSVLVAHPISNGSIAEEQPAQLITHHAPGNCGAVLVEHLQSSRLETDQVVFFATTSNGTPTNDYFVMTLTRLRDVVRELTDAPAPAQLTVVTHGGVAPNCHSPEQGAAYGFARTIELEHPELHCRRIDLDSLESLESQMPDLAAELSRSSRGAISYRNGKRYVGRMARISLDEPIAHAEERDAFNLTIDRSGSSSRLKFDEHERIDPCGNEVEIQVKAAGVNFIDALDFADLLPIKRDWLGVECAGTIVRIGPEVRKLHVGDDVIALTAGCFRSHVTVSASLVRKSRCLEQSPYQFSSAATIPAGFLTAERALRDVANLQPGERILIHAATGGTGMAAVKVAQEIGAEVFATASRRKWQMLHKLGVRHILDSRSTDFADQVMEITEGKGVHVVLNSLTGEFVERGLQTLTSGGRFIELGKRDIWPLDRVKAVRNDVAYHVVDLLGFLESFQNATEGQSEVENLFDRLGNIESTLPKSVFAATESPAALRYMQRAAHIGKVVIDFSKSCLPIDGQSSYLITGGFGGLGIATAEWLAENGARNIVLVGRNLPDKLPLELRNLASEGIAIETRKCDVSNRESLESTLAYADSIAPLKGVVHAAGLVRDARLTEITAEHITEVLAPKAIGAWHLHELSKTRDLDFFVLYSSAASLIGSPGQANHVAANSFLDSLAEHRRCLGLPATSIQWGPWAELGYAADESVQRRLKQRGIRAIMPDSAVKVIETVLQRPDLDVVGAVSIDWSQLAVWASNDDLLGPLCRTNVESSEPSWQKADWRKKLETLPAGQRAAALETMLQSELGRALGYGPDQRVSVKTGFFDLGLDSLMSVDLKNRISKKLDFAVSTTALFEHSNIRDLAVFLLTEMKNENDLDTVPSHTPTTTTEIEPQGSNQNDVRVRIAEELKALESLLDGEKSP
ncbi:MAG: SDR family NAD(P)-dependent oxidoreductase [Planctomycetota bacterium]